MDRVNEVIEYLKTWVTYQRWDNNPAADPVGAVCLKCVQFDLTIDETIEVVNKFREHKYYSPATDEEIIRHIEWADRGGDQRGTLRQFTNFREVKSGDKKVTVPLRLADIREQLDEVTEGWPRRIDTVLFVDDGEAVHFFDRRGPAGLFGWLHSRCKVIWKNGIGYISQSEFFAELERTAARYDSIELLPHEPQLPNIYYVKSNTAGGDGQAFNNLLSRFCPETTIDRELIKAMFMTLFWGGPPGRRPLFLITSDEGRGVGKTTLAEVAAYLAGGYLDISPQEDINNVKQRLLSPAGQMVRTIVVDNIKSHRFSWAEFESLITTPIISGKRMYVGEGQRPNLLTPIVTMNGVSAAEDISQRAVIIKLIKANYTGSWWEDTTRFIDENRAAIIGDILALLRAESQPLANYSRWGTWEQAILSKLDTPNEVQQIILERQGEASCDREEAQMVEDYFAEQIKEGGADPATSQLRIKVRTCCQWLRDALGNNKLNNSAASSKLRQMISEGQIKKLAPDSGRRHGRCFIWTGETADNQGSPITNYVEAA